jgi:hypothetical protein
VEWRWYRPRALDDTARHHLPFPKLQPTSQHTLLLLLTDTSFSPLLCDTDFILPFLRLCFGGFAGLSKLSCRTSGPTAHRGWAYWDLGLGGGVLGWAALSRFIITVSDGQWFGWLVLTYTVWHDGVPTLYLHPSLSVHSGRRHGLSNASFAHIPHHTHHARAIPLHIPLFASVGARVRNACIVLFLLSHML